MVVKMYSSESNFYLDIIFIMIFIMIFIILWYLLYYIYYDIYYIYGHLFSIVGKKQTKPFYMLNDQFRSRLAFAEPLPVVYVSTPL